jgi:hypothetical protein
MAQRSISCVLPFKSGLKYSHSGSLELTHIFLAFRSSFFRPKAVEEKLKEEDEPPGGLKRKNEPGEEPQDSSTCSGRPTVPRAKMNLLFLHGSCENIPVNLCFRTLVE